MPKLILYIHVPIIVNTYVIQLFLLKYERTCELHAKASPSSHSLLLVPVVVYYFLFPRASMIWNLCDVIKMYDNPTLWQNYH